MNNQLRISAKNLGQLALPTFCERCFWIRMRCTDRLPFQVFPGIFSSIDSYSKKLTNGVFDKHATLPTWLKDHGIEGEPIHVPHWSHFRITDEEAGIMLTGVPDEIVRRPDGSLYIVDYKTARYTNGQDKLKPLYGVQLNAYAHIAERIGLGQTTGLVLAYYEPVTEVHDPDSLTTDIGFVMNFTPHMAPIALEPESIGPLLKRVRRICAKRRAPKGREGCKDCSLLENLVAVVSENAHS